MASEQPATEARSGEEQKSPPPPATTSLPPPLSLSSGGAQGKEREIEERMEQLALDNKISEVGHSASIVVDSIYYVAVQIHVHIHIQLHVHV